jgi:hypothetical protein
MTSQLYLTGRLAANPEAATTRKGKLWIKLLLETEFVREPKPGEFQTESVTIPISCFAYSAEQVKNPVRGASITVGVHLSGTKFENGGVTKHGVQLVAEAWERQGVSINDACAALHLHLAELMPLVLVVFSASKSLHGWYRVWGLTLKERAKFMRYAVSLGADPATWTRSQFVRMPDGLREENGKRQVTYFFNPQEAIKDGAS